MTLEKIVQALELEPLTAPPAPAQGAAVAAGQEAPDISKAHVSDLLSDVLANAPAGGILLTIQVHMNVLAVAVHAGLAGVIFTSGMKPEEAVRVKAAAENVPLFATALSTFDAVGKLYALGLRGSSGRAQPAGGRNSGQDRGRDSGQHGGRGA